MTYMHFLFDLVHVIKLHVTHNLYASDLFLELHQYLYAIKPTQVLHLSAHKHSCFLVSSVLGWWEYCTLVYFVAPQESCLYYPNPVHGSLETYSSCPYKFHSLPFSQVPTNVPKPMLRTNNKTINTRLA
jgi:hypothetical protein